MYVQNVMWLYTVMLFKSYTHIHTNIYAIIKDVEARSIGEKVVGDVIQ